MENRQLTKVDRNKKIKKKMEIQNNWKAKDKKAVVTPYILIITPNINGLNSSIKRHKNVWMDKKTRSNYMLPTGDSCQL